MQELFTGGVGIAVLIGSIILVAMWVYLPFAVWGIKTQLMAILVELRRINAAPAPSHPDFVSCQHCGDQRPSSETFCGECGGKM